MANDANFFSHQYRHQLKALLAVHLITIGYGVTVGWTAPIIPLLQSADTPLPSGPITVEEASWVGSCLCIGGMTGTILFALIHTYFGKKVGLLLLAVPHLILWTLLMVGDSVYYIYVARVMSGLTGGGICSILPLFVADIADRKIRGTLGSLTILHINFGLLASYIAGNYLSYYTIPKVMLCLPVAFLGLVCLLPETPYCLLRKGKTDEAEKSLMFYRNIPDASRKTLVFEYEFESLKAFTMAEKSKQSLTFADFTTPAAIRGLSIGLFVVALNQFSGIFAILTYAGTILQASGSSVESKYVLILLALINICGNLTSFAIIDKAGRKIFLLISTVGVGVSLGLMGLHSYFSDSSDYSWVPVLCLTSTIYAAALGITNVPFFILPEILPPKLRSIGSTISMVSLCFFAFIMVKAFPILLENIQIHGTVWISTAVCIVAVLIIVFLVPETKGKNLVLEEENNSSKSRVDVFYESAPKMVHRSAVAGNISLKSVCNQFLGAIAVNIITLGHGAVIGWVSPFLPYLQSNETHLTSGPVNIEQASWIGSTLCIGGLIGATTFGLLADRLGKKLGLQLVAIPQLGFWLCILLGTNVYHLYLGRILAGCGGGGILRAIPLYIADIADCRLRGMLGSVLIITLNLGILVGFVLGNYLTYFTVPAVMLSAPVIFLVATYFLPETPYCLLKKNQSNKAERSLMFYRGIEGHLQKSVEFCNELEQLQMAVRAEQESLDKNRLTWGDFCTTQARKGLGIGIFLMLLNQFSGALAIITYTATIFEESGSDLSPKMSSIIVALIQLVGTIISFTLVDNLGRKILLLISTSGTAVGLFSMGLFSFLQQNGYDLSQLQSLPIISLSVTILLSSIGILSLPFVILAEVLPQKIRNVGSTISITMVSTSAFVVLKLFPVMMDRIKLFGTMWVLSSFCFLAIFFIMLVIPETKGKNLVATDNRQ
ncbi:uncharacterized protein LOC131679891 [Topomyia yanbarensis]|uniref:uncharacterized protein LOC131679891 n=1 Tax=Topomyia yanbarensis TaxID=2498891 RepID=UPI00273CE026|nr:uncharacterized protein LOC131679891 [Topomyia yanbarensis]